MATVAKLEAVLSADTTRFDSAMARSQGQMEGAKRIITGAALGIAGGVGFLGVKAVSAAADFEAGLNKMQAVSGATNEQMKEISKTAIKLGNDTKLPGTSAKDAAEAMTELAKSGLNVDQTMKAVRSTLVLSAASGVSNARAAEIASNALNAFGLDASKTGRVVDFLANAANASSIEIEDAADAMKMAGAVFSGFQGPAVGAEQALKDLNTAVAILGNAGIKGSDAGTALKQMLLQLTGPSDKAKGAMRALYVEAMNPAAASSENLTKALQGGKDASEALSSISKQAGASVQAGGDIAFDAAGKMRPLKEIIDLVAAGTKTMTQEQRSAYITMIFGADASRAVIALMRQQGEGWDTMAEKIGKAGAAEELAAAKMKGLRGAQEALRSSLDTLAITFGLVLLPYVQSATQALTNMTGFIAEHQSAAIAVTGVLFTLAALYLTTRANIMLVTAAQNLGTLAHNAFALATGRATAAQLGLNTAMRANIIGAIITALQLLVVGVVIAYQKSETFRNIVDGLWGALQTFFGVLKAVAGWIIENAARVGGLLEAIFRVTPLGVLITRLDDVFGLLRRFATWVIENGGKILDPLIDGFRALARWIGEVIDGIKWLIAKIPSLPKLPDINPFGGDVRDPRMMLPPQGPVGAGRADVSPALWDELSGAQRFGLVLTSGYRPGAITRSGTRSDHSYYPSKAIDVTGSAGAMARFFTWLIGNRGVKQAFYDPLGSIFGGVLSSYREGGHSDHVHVATYDRGGFLRPGWNLAYNGLGRPEPVGVGNITIPVSIGGEHVATVVFDMLRRKAQVFERNNQRPAFGAS